MARIPKTNHGSVNGCQMVGHFVLANYITAQSHYPPHPESCNGTLGGYLTGTPDVVFPFY